MEVEEESPHGTLVGSIAAYDPDIGDNALIDYIITGIFLFFNNNNNYNNKTHHCKTKYIHLYILQTCKFYNVHYL